MKMLSCAAFAALLLAAAPAFAQWQTPNHSVPIGQGIGITGFKSVAPSTSGQPLVSQGATSDPAFQALNLGGAGVTGQLPNANLVNPSTTVNGQTCTLGAACTLNTFANLYANHAAFGGKPWADVTSGLNGCGIAVGDNSTDNTTAIQCYLTYMYNTYGGGVVFFPAGNYKITSTLTVKGGTLLWGFGDTATVITGTTDFTLLTFDATIRGGGLSGIFVVGYTASTGTQPVVKVIAGAVGAVFRDCHMWGGSSAFNTDGGDGYMENCFIAAFATGGASVVSTGANWYHRVKIDTAGVTIGFAFVQNTCVIAPAACENHFVMSDFSGSYSTDSVNINDAYAITVIADSVMSSPIHISAAKGTSLVGNEVGSGTLVVNSVGQIAMVGNLGLGAITVSGSATRSCAGNVAITC